MATSTKSNSIAEIPRTGNASQGLSDALHFAFSTQRYSHTHALAKLTDAQLDEHEARLLRDLAELKEIRRVRAATPKLEFAHTVAALGLPSLLPRPTAAFMHHVEEVTPNVFTFPLLSPAACDALLSQLDAYTAHASRHPTVSRSFDSSRFHIPLAWLGMHDLAAHLLQAIVAPLSSMIFPKLCTCSGTPCAHTRTLLDFQYAYVIGYNTPSMGPAAAARTSLRSHTDDSEVTLNVSLGRSFTGGELIFRGLRGDADEGSEEARVALPRGHALLHLGQQLHEVTPVTAGERYSLIVWCRSSAFRLVTCPCCLIQRSPGPCVCDGWLT